MSTARPVPNPTADTLPFWRAANEGKLVVQTCRSCNAAQFYPRGFCVTCLSDDFEWKESQGLGRIYSFTICRIAGHPSMVDKVPYAMALIDLDEGVRMLAQIMDSDLDDVAIGARVALTFERLTDDIQLPQFVLAPLDAPQEKQ